MTDFHSWHCMLCYRAEEVEGEVDREHSRGSGANRMQHVTSRRKVEGRDFVESIHPAPSDHLRKDGREWRRRRRRLPMSGFLVELQMLCSALLTLYIVCGAGSMYETVEHLSVRLSIPPFDSSSGVWRVCCWVLSRQQILIDSLRCWRCIPATGLPCSRCWAAAEAPCVALSSKTP